MAREKPEPPRQVATLSDSAHDALIYKDAGIAAYTTAKLTTDQMALALTLHSDELSGTIGDLIAVAQTV